MPSLLVLKVSQIVSLFYIPIFGKNISIRNNSDTKAVRVELGLVMPILTGLVFLVFKSNTCRLRNNSANQCKQFDKSWVVFWELQILDDVGEALAEFASVLGLDES
jgi:hypothetical protein